MREISTATGALHEVPQGSGRRLRSAALIVVLSLASGFTSAAHALDWNLGDSKPVFGSGTIKTERRSVAGFTGISLALGGLVEIQQGSTEGVSIETDDNLLGLIETVVENGTLKIRAAHRNASFTSNKMKFTVNLKTIDSLDIAGSGDIRADSLKAAELKANIAGSGDIQIRSLEVDGLKVSIAGSGDFVAGGHARNLRASVAGSGDIMAEKLDTKTAEVSIAGSGDATVWVRESLTVRVDGSGDVNYYGDARVTKSIRGSGSIKQLGAAPAGS